MKNNKSKYPGCLVISLDFEMMWGVIDLLTPEGYGQTNVAQVREVIPRMVELFEKYDVKATFAAVGMLMLDGVKEVQEAMPLVKPSYKNNKLSPYENGYIENIKEKDSNLYFAPDLIDYLKKSKNIEIGTHTFCHYYCDAEGQTVEQFEADLKVAIEVARTRGIALKSIIFPRNQVSKEYLTICAKLGIETYRGNPCKFFSKPKNVYEVWRDRIGRLVDAYVNVGGKNSYSYEDIDTNEIPINIKASRFFRPYMTKLAFMEPLRIRRIKKEMEYAARNGEVYHLWWHPHNFGANMEANLKNLQKVLDFYVVLRERYYMLSLTMKDLKTIINNE